MKTLKYLIGGTRTGSSKYENIPLDELKVGDQFYFINNKAFLLCQITKIIKNKTYTRLYYDDDYRSHDILFCKGFEDEGCTQVHKGYDYCLTTIKSIAEQKHNEYCPEEKLIKYLK